MSERPRADSRSGPPGNQGLAIADLSSSTSSLLNDVLMQIEFQRSGRYQDPDDFTLDWGGRGQTGVR